MLSLMISFFLYSLSQSAGVWVAVRCNIGVMAIKFTEMQGQLLALDLNFGSNNLCLINLYALNDKFECQDFLLHCQVFLLLILS